ncbi:MAG: amidinotransferase [Ardenticatenaceae bacterium]|nr:amidinotransferase [Ardenticatenaceae bacterium]MCB9445455.1 amidinotransferase [Ardenticatenaceae bacterium]
MTFTHAITRKPGLDFAEGITTAKLGTPDYELMMLQHAAYINALRALGLMTIELDTLPGHPDAYFVEDVAVVTPEVAVITRPGAPSRQGEEATMALVLSQHRPVAPIKSPGTLDGGDVLMVGSRCFVGLSERTNAAGAGQLARILGDHGYNCTAVPVAAGLHFKSSVNWVGGKTLLVTADFAGQPELADYEQIVVPEGEEAAANVLLVNGRLLIPQGYPQTRKKLIDWGADIIELNMSEAAKMDGGLTCMSLRF